MEQSFFHIVGGITANPTRKKGTFCAANDRDKGPLQLWNSPVHQRPGNFFVAKALLDDIAWLHGPDFKREIGFAHRKRVNGSSRFG